MKENYEVSVSPQTQNLIGRFWCTNALRLCNEHHAVVHEQSYYKKLNSYDESCVGGAAGHFKRFWTIGIQVHVSCTRPIQIRVCRR